MDLQKMLDELLVLVVDEPKRFGPIVWGLPTNEISMQIAKIKACLPDEVKQAAKVTRESDRIVESAREDAQMTLDQAHREAESLIEEAMKQGENIREQARLEQSRMLRESEIVKLAKAQSEQLRLSADLDANQLRRGAENYAHDVLTQLEGVVMKVMSSIDKGKQQIQPSDLAVIEPKERIRS